MAYDLEKDKDIWALRDTLKKSFKERDKVWQNRRDVRFRRMGEQLASLPLNPMISDKALLISQTEIPNQEAHKRTKRLVANPPRFEVIITDDDNDSSEMAQELEHGIMALYKWVNRGKVSFDYKVTQHQQSDGLGIGAVDHLPGHGKSLAKYDLETLIDPETGERGPDADEDAYEEFNNARSKYGLDDGERDSKAYNEVTEKALQKENPPYRFRAVDPLTFYYWADADQISVGMECGRKSLNPLLEAYKEQGLRIENDRFVVGKGGPDAVSAKTFHDPSDGHSTTVTDTGEMVSYTEIRTKDKIIICLEHPIFSKPDVPKPKAQKVEDDYGRGVVFRFDNPFGPYTTGYVLVPGDVTTDSQPEDEFQPPILQALNEAQKLNVLETARLSAALEEALAEKYIKLSPEAPVTPTDEDKTPSLTEGREIVAIQGEIKKIDSNNVDLDKSIDMTVRTMESGKMEEVLVGDAASEATGNRLAYQIAQADIQMVPYQNSRAEAITELIKGVIYSIKKQGLSVYIPTIPSGTRKGSNIRVSKPAKLTPEMADLSFELIVTLGAETAMTKFAKWQAYAQRERDGTMGYQTLIELSDVENPEEELNRIVEGKMFKALLEATVPLATQMLVASLEKQVMMVLQPDKFAQMGDQAESEELNAGPTGESGLANGGGGEAMAEDLVRNPGVNMPVVQSNPVDGQLVPMGSGEQLPLPIG